MLESHPIHPKIKELKYPYLFSIVFILFYFNTLDSYAQKAHVDASLFKEGLLELNFKDNWKYQPGDNPDWANPDFDDSGWYNIDPNGLKAYQMPNSLWSGFGWWRITFSADPKSIEAIERLYFYSCSRLCPYTAVCGTYRFFKSNFQ